MPPSSASGRLPAPILPPPPHGAAARVHRLPPFIYHRLPKLVSSCVALLICWLLERRAALRGAWLRRPPPPHMEMECPSAGHRHAHGHDPGPFTVVVLVSRNIQERFTRAYVYSSEADHWSESARQPILLLTNQLGMSSNVAVRVCLPGTRSTSSIQWQNKGILEYDLGKKEMSVIGLPPPICDDSNDASPILCSCQWRMVGWDSPWCWISLSAYGRGRVCPEWMDMDPT